MVVCFVRPQKEYSNLSNEALHEVLGYPRSICDGHRVHPLRDTVVNDSGLGASISCGRSSVRGSVPSLPDYYWILSR